RERHRDGRPRVAAAPEPRAEPEEGRAGEDRGERPRHPERHPDAAEEPEQQHQERDETDERVAEDLERRQERDQEDRHAGDGAKQGGARHDPTRPVPAHTAAAPRHTPTVTPHYTHIKVRNATDHAYLSKPHRT